MSQIEEDWIFNGLEYILVVKLSSHMSARHYQWLFLHGWDQSQAAYRHTRTHTQIPLSGDKSAELIETVDSGQMKGRSPLMSNLLCVWFKRNVQPTFSCKNTSTYDQAGMTMQLPLYWGRAWLLFPFLQQRSEILETHWWCNIQKLSFVSYTNKLTLLALNFKLPVF